MELCLAIAFAVTNFKGLYNAAAILEWVVAFVFSFYVFSFFVDLYPAAKTSRGGVGFKPAGMNDSPREMDNSYHMSNGDNIDANPRYTQDSSQPINGRAQKHKNQRGVNF